MRQHDNIVGLHINAQNRYATQVTARFAHWPAGTAALPLNFSSNGKFVYVDTTPLPHGVWHLSVTLQPLPGSAETPPLLTEIFSVHIGADDDCGCDGWGDYGHWHSGNEHTGCRGCDAHGHGAYARREHWHGGCGCDGHKVPVRDDRRDFFLAEGIIRGSQWVWVFSYAANDVVNARFDLVDTHSPSVTYSFSTATSNVVVDAIRQTVTITLSAADTAAIDPTTRARYEFIVTGTQGDNPAFYSGYIDITPGA